MQNYDYIIGYYGVPAEYGREIEYKGRKGFIVSSIGQYVGVTFHDEKPNRIHPFHPIDGITYLGIGKPRKMTRSQLRYIEYLQSDTDLKFIDWLDYIGKRKDR